MAIRRPGNASKMSTSRIERVSVSPPAYPAHKPHKLPTTAPKTVALTPMLIE